MSLPETQVPQGEKEPLEIPIPEGMIYPPPDIKTIVEKTAVYVAQSGPILEQKIIETEKDNKKFSFLNVNDPYHLFYRYMVDKSKRGEEEMRAQKSTQQQSAAPGTNQEAESVVALPEQPENFNFTYPVPSISAQDLQVLKLTAQYVAQNGRGFMTALMKREQRNYQFDFMKPTHSLFQYFMQLVEQYTRIIAPSEELLEQIREFNIEPNVNNSKPSARRPGSKSELMERINRRAKWQAYQEEMAKIKQDEEAKEREAFNSIDWHDFVVVGTLEITEADFITDLPPPLKLADLQNMTLADKASLVSKSALSQHSTSLETANVPAESVVKPVDSSVLVDQYTPANGHTGTAIVASGSGSGSGSDVEMEEDNEDIQETPENVILPRLESATQPIKIKSNYTAKLLQSTVKNMWKCPICNESIPDNEIDHHIRVEMLDPKYKEQRLVYEAKIRDSNLLTSGSDISAHLNRLSSVRSDIFGDQNTATEPQSQSQPQTNASLASNDSSIKRQPVIWDGFTSSAQDVIRRANIGFSTDEQIADIHRRKGLIPTRTFDPSNPNLPQPPFDPTVIGPQKRPLPFSPQTADGHVVGGSNENGNDAGSENQSGNDPSQHKKTRI
ncbi:Pre-mRNA-splicing factor [Zancudomyces culisetae]|uniref:Pre-mRNA-splicing factor n=1 Tax=Zancudomyces culisetae TaxID=1213189 RepID=A0A1R1PQ60_ZANCU|nr:Pre-mRNA-splicing factor [Zancudomyces culisetae]|eukprot:OMH83089.1 Pre-mRNA-splicing factor [Zancudomyces culisetae]